MFGPMHPLYLRERLKLALGLISAFGLVALLIWPSIRVRLGDQRQIEATVVRVGARPHLTGSRPVLTVRIADGSVRQYSQHLQPSKAVCQVGGST